MNKVIKNKLFKIEQKENVKILVAVESGSRAWGFASPDSDYDVRFIYVHPKEFYLKLERTRDVIELPIDDVFDINGWDLQKTLRLLNTSNPTLFEWANSPIVYKTSDFFEEFRKVINNYFKEKAGLYHYLNTAKRNYGEYLKGDMVKAKKYFYIVRPVLACKWILKNQTPPPMLFSTLMESVLEEDMKPIIYNLIKLKTNLPEIGEIPKIVALNDYIDKNLEELKQEIDELPNSKNNSFDELNKLFLSTFE